MTVTLVPPLPHEVQVEVTGACNLRCRMCLVRYRPPLDRVSASMSFDRFRTLVDELDGLESLTLQGLGEPLLAPDLMTMVRHAVARGVAVGFNTNGTLLTRARAEELVDAGVDWVHVSVDGATAATFEHIRDRARFAKVIANLRGLVAARRAAGRDRPRLQLNVVAMRANAGELPDLVRLAAAIGVDRMWVQNLSHDFSDTDPAGEYRGIRQFAAEQALSDDDGDGDGGRRAALAAAAATAAELGVDLRLPTAIPKEEPGCDWPWRSAYITHDGKVQPCCMVMGADRAVLGELGDRSFAEIWHGPEYQAFRAALLSDEPPSVCRGCAAYRHRF